jgi:TfuA protein
MQRNDIDASRRPVIFLGPSLCVSDARLLLEADYRPPARHGDVLRAARERPPLIGLIDGEFLANLPPSPMEVSEALRTCVPILGSSSLGALRAVELEPYGMIGIGAIFEMFRNGDLVADDEVALVFDSGDLRALSEPLVNIRYALSSALQAGVITSGERMRLLGFARKIYFAERSWPLLLQKAGKRLPVDVLYRLREFLAVGDFDLKKQDAVLLLQRARQLMVAAGYEASRKPRTI